MCLERDDAHIWNVATVLPYLERYDAHFSDRYLERIDAPICQDTMSIFGMMRLHCHIWRCDVHIWKYTMPIFVKIQCHIGTGATALPYLDRHDAIFGKMVQQCHCPPAKHARSPLCKGTHTCICGPRIAQQHASHVQLPQGCGPMGWDAPTTVTCIKFWQKIMALPCNGATRAVRDGGTRWCYETGGETGAVRPARGGATRSVRAARSARDDTARPVRDAARSVQDSATRSARDGAARSVQDGATRSVRDGAARSVQMVEGLYVRSCEIRCCEIGVRDWYEMLRRLVRDGAR